MSDEPGGAAPRQGGPPPDAAIPPQQSGAATPVDEEFDPLAVGSSQPGAAPATQSAAVPAPAIALAAGLHDGAPVVVAAASAVAIPPVAPPPPPPATRPPVAVAPAGQAALPQVPPGPPPPPPRAAAPRRDEPMADQQRPRQQTPRVLIQAISPDHFDAAVDEQVTIVVQAVDSLGRPLPNVAISLKANPWGAVVFGTEGKPYASATPAMPGPIEFAGRVKSVPCEVVAVGGTEADGRVICTIGPRTAAPAQSGAQHPLAAGGPQPVLVMTPGTPATAPSAQTPNPASEAGNPYKTQPASGAYRTKRL